MKLDRALYTGREQTYFKHLFLMKYLERGAIIIGRWADAFTFVDGFSGPWQTRSEELKDTSFAIALQELRQARDVARDKFKRDMKPRAYFIEKDGPAYAQLRKFADEQKDVEIGTRNSEFEDAIPDIVEFVRGGGTSNFTFVFVDPKGWTGFALKRLAALLKLANVEALINFQTGFIKRFITLSREEFEELFGDTAPLDEAGRLAAEEREDYLIFEYAKRVKAAGGFAHVCAAAVPRPDIEKSHFHLIYVTRHPKGVEVFKNAERACVEVMPEIRGKAKTRKREERTGQLELPGTMAPASRYIDERRDHYRGIAQHTIRQRLMATGRLPYDEAWAMAMSFPLVWESDLKEWVREWGVRIEGLGPSERTPKRDSGHVLVVKKS